MGEAYDKTGSQAAIAVLSSDRQGMSNWRGKDAERAREGGANGYSIRSRETGPRAAGARIPSERGTAMGNRISRRSRVDRHTKADLVRRMSSGDSEALEEFYETYFPRLYRYVYYRVGRDHHHTEEVVNDTFMEALEKAERYDPDRGSIESWLITLSRNRIRSCNAVMGRPREYERSWSMLDGELESLFAEMDQGNVPEKALESEELRDLVNCTMNAISEPYMKLLEMKYMLNLSVREIAGKLDKTEKSVESQLTRARNAFRDAFSSLAVEMPAF